MLKKIMEKIDNMFKNILIAGGVKKELQDSTYRESKIKRLLESINLELKDTEILRLNRIDKTDKHTLGILTLPDGSQLYTIEPPDKGNQINISCVPEGLYMLLPHNGTRYKNTYAFVNPMLDVYHLSSDVPKEKRGKARTACVFHAANWAHELRGCIAPGTAQKLLSGKEAVTNSNTAMKMFRNKLGLDKIKYVLEITSEED